MYFDIHLRSDVINTIKDEEINPSEETLEGNIKNGFVKRFKMA